MVNINKQSFSTEKKLKSQQRRLSPTSDGASSPSSFSISPFLLLPPPDAVSFPPSPFCHKVAPLNPANGPVKHSELLGGSGQGSSAKQFWCTHIWLHGALFVFT